jgi:hypothetical protein
MRGDQEATHVNLALGPNKTPLGLDKNTWPLALMRPKIWLAWVSSTRLRVTALAEGWTKLTWAWAPTLKLFQFSTARLLDWLMLRLLPLWPMLAVPATTLPPWGSWVAEMAALCAQACAQLALNQTKAQPMACAQGLRAWGCSSGAAGAFLIMIERAKTAGSR